MLSSLQVCYLLGYLTITPACIGSGWIVMASTSHHWLVSPLDCIRWIVLDSTGGLLAGPHLLTTHSQWITLSPSMSMGFFPKQWWIPYHPAVILFTIVSTSLFLCLGQMHLANYLQLNLQCIHYGQYICLGARLDQCSLHTGNQ